MLSICTVLVLTGWCGSVVHFSGNCGVSIIHESVTGTSSVALSSVGLLILSGTCHPFILHHVDAFLECRAHDISGDHFLGCLCVFFAGIRGLIRSHTKSTAISHFF
jgi:hypothetical protein